jgi:hypothetical protein
MMSVRLGTFPESGLKRLFETISGTRVAVRQNHPPKLWITLWVNRRRIAQTPEKQRSPTDCCIFKHKKMYINQMLSTLLKPRDRGAAQKKHLRGRCGLVLGSPLAKSTSNAPKRSGEGGR